jgi:glycosyltransferase involved in cell wall biosynthesis
MREEARQADCVINSGTLWTHVGYSAWRACRRFGKPSVTYPRGVLSPWALAFKPLRKRIHWTLLGRRMVDDSSAIVALATRELAEIKSLGLRPPIELIRNGAKTPPEDRPLTRDELSERLPGLGGRPYVLFLGRLHQKKGLDLLIPSIRRLGSDFPNTIFVLAGSPDPGYASTVRRLLEGNSVGNRVLMTGAVSGDLKSLLLQFAEVFVLPSYSEGLPIAVLEALAHSRPVVITDMCNLPEVVAAGAGFEIPPHIEAVTESLRRLLSDPELRAEMGRSARRLAREQFSWPTIAQNTLALCRRVAGHAGSPEPEPRLQVVGSAADPGSAG